MKLVKFLVMAFVAVSFLFVSNGAFAQLAAGGLTKTGAGAAQALSTTAVKFTAFTDLLPSTSTDGDKSVVASVANDNVAVVKGGLYLIRFAYAGTGSSTDAVTFSVRDGSTAIDGAQSTVNHAASTSVSATIDTIYKPTADGSLSVFAVAAANTPSVTATASNLVVIRIK